MKMSNQLYDTLVWTAQILLPALGTAYFGLSRIWGFPFADQVVGTIVVVDTFLGVLLGITNNAYKKEMAAKAEA